MSDTTFLGLSSDIIITGTHAKIIKKMCDDKDQILFIGKTLDLLALTSLIGFKYNRMEKPNKDGTDFVSLSRTTFSGKDNEMWFIGRLIHICSDNQSQQNRIDDAFRYFGQDEIKNKMYKDWLSYSLGGLSIINEKVMNPSKNDKQLMADLYLELIRDLTQNVDNTTVTTINKLLHEK
jgi:hypothetical protein